MKRKKRSISDKERLEHLFEKSGEMLTNGKYRVCFQDLRGTDNQTYRQALDAAIRASRASRKESK